MDRDNIFETMLARINRILDGDGTGNDKMERICNLLKNNVPEYDWVGFYLVDKNVPDELVLGPFAGEPTEHKRIKFGQGICGQAASRRESFIVGDVSKEENYLSCSPFVKSEIVVPVFRNGQIIGELDIDSQTPAAFNRNDEKFLRRIGELVAEII